MPFFEACAVHVTSTLQSTSVSYLGGRGLSVAASFRRTFGQNAFGSENEHGKGNRANY